MGGFLPRTVLCVCGLKEVEGAPVLLLPVVEDEVEHKSDGPSLDAVVMAQERAMLPEGDPVKVGLASDLQARDLRDGTHDSV